MGSKSRKVEVASYRARIETAPTSFNFEDWMLRDGLARKLPKNIDITTSFSTNIPLNLPFVSSPMDTVTGPAMAIRLGMRGSLGVLHRNCTVEDEVEMVKAVKRATAFIITEPETVTIETTVEQARETIRRTGYSGLPVVEGKKLVGLISKKSLLFEKPSIPIGGLMLTLKDLVTAHHRVTEPEARKIMKRDKIEKLPVIDKKGNLRGLITSTDIISREEHKEALRDSDGRLLVAAAVGPYDLERAQALEKAGANAIVVDVATAYSTDVLKGTKRILRGTGIDIVAGNWGSTEGVEYGLRKLDVGRGIAGLRVGIGSGSICKTTNVTTAGSPTLFAVMETNTALIEMGMRIPIGADGGIRVGGHIALAMALGASYGMLGYMLAGADESPGRVVYDKSRRKYKEYYGMGSNAARAKRASVDRYADTGGKRLEEGIKIRVPTTGAVDGVVDEIVAEVRASMGYAGATNVKEMLRSRIMRVPHKVDKGVIEVDDDGN